MPRNKTHGRGKSQQVASPSLSPERGSDTDTQSVASSMHPADSPVNLKKKLVTRSDLSSEEQEVMVKWLKEHPILYNTKLSSYKDKAKKGALWNEQTVLLEKDVSILHVWYRSIRTRFGKLAKLKSGFGSGERTERDLWVLENCKFLKSHIHEVQPRTVVSAKLVYQGSIQCEDDPELANPDGIQGLSTSITNTDEPTLLDARHKRSRVSQEEERLLHTLDERGRQLIKLHEKLLGMVKPPSAPSKRDTFGDWVKSELVDLGPSLWRQFQQEQTSLLYKYLDLNDQVRSQTPQPQQQHPWGTPLPPHQQWQPSQQTQRSQQPHWQRFPENWSTTMSATMVQGKPQNVPALTKRQLLQSTPKNPAQNICAASPSNEDTSLSGCFSNSFMEMLNQNK